MQKQNIHRREKRPREKLLHKVVQGLHSVFVKRLHGTSQIRSKDIYEASAVEERTFKRNFSGADDILYYTYEEIAGVFEEISFIPDHTPNVKNCLEMLLIKLRQHDDALRVALDRSDLVFWQETIAIIKPIIVYDWSYLSSEAIDLAYRVFSAIFIDELEKWESLDFSKDYIMDCVYFLLHELRIIKDDWHYWKQRMDNQ